MALSQSALLILNSVIILNSKSLTDRSHRLKFVEKTVYRSFILFQNSSSYRQNKKKRRKNNRNSYICTILLI